MARNMNSVYENEQYMSDAATSVFSNFVRAAEKRNNSIWSGPTYDLKSCVKSPDNVNSNDVLNETNKTDEFTLLKVLNENMPGNLRDAPHHIHQGKSYYHESPSSTKHKGSHRLDHLESSEHRSIINNSSLEDKRKIHRRKSYSPGFLSTLGLKFMSSSIPKQSSRKTKKVATEEKYKDVNFRNGNLVGNGNITKCQVLENKNDSSELKLENNEIVDDELHSLKFVAGSLTQTTLKSDDVEEFLNVPEKRFVHDEFQQWCRQRKTDYKMNSPVKIEINPPAMDPHIEPLVYAPICPPIHPPINPPIRPPVYTPIHLSTSLELLEADKLTISDSNVTLNIPMQTETTLKKRVRHDSSNSSKHDGKATTNVKKRISDENSSGIQKDSTETMLCITVFIKGNKYHDVTIELSHFLRLKRRYPGFEAILPDVDCEEKEMGFSADAVKTVLGLLFSPSYKVHNILNEITAVEVLALVYAWDIVKLQNVIQNHCLQNILKVGNVKKIYSLADHFNLTEMKDACLKLSKDVNTMKYRERKCSIAVSTYMDPLEFSISLHPAEGLLTESFDRSILNEIVFESFSGYYVITGIQIQLNVENSINNPSKLKIFYSAENITENLEIPEEKIDKNLSSRIIIYFKKNLFIQPNQKGKISIYTDIKPCLCYTFENKVIKKKFPSGEFSLTLNSNHTVPKSDNKKSFLIGKLFYHLKNTAR